MKAISKPLLKQAVFFILILIGNSFTSFAQHRMKAKTKAQLIKYIVNEYPDQFTNPEKRTRKTFSQFGYGLSQFTVPFFPITKFIERDKYGYQSYGKPNRSKEKNGAIYTCRGGFIDFSHMRQAIDWTVYLSFKILDNGKDIELPKEAGILKLHFTNLDKLTKDDIVSMAQKIAFERLLWHEVASWHYHKPYRVFNEQQSTFTPEDNYSNFLGTIIGKKVALRILNDTSSNLSYSIIASEQIEKMMTSLQPVKTKKESKMAYDIVDRNKQRKLPEGIRNKDVWYDSKIVFRDQRHVFKRDMDIGPELEPWLVPRSAKLGCPADIKPEVLQVPQLTQAGNSFYKHYEFSIIPDSNLFYDYKKNKELHPPFGKFITENLSVIIEHIRKQMAAELMPGFDKRDKKDPTVYFKNAKKVLFR